MKKYVIFALLLAAAASLTGGENSLLFRNFSGSNQGSFSRNAPLYPALGWNRLDGHWASFEPKEGQWSEEAFKQYTDAIKANAEQGITMLPVLCYGNGWANEKLPYEYVYGDHKTVYAETPEKKTTKTIYKKNGNQWIKEKEEVTDSTFARPIGQKYVRAWERYVEKMVSTLSKPPYNLKYFQIWNEASPLSGFWAGDFDTYMRRIHLPAAKIIKKYGCKVVYGGWPCCNNPKELIGMLDRHKAWSSLDVIDLHYFGLNEMKWMRAEGLKRGYNIGSWQTELGFHQNYLMIPAMYPEAMQYMLEDRRFNPDLIKLFYFAYWSPDDPKAYGYGCCLYRGEKLSPHGKALENLGEMFKNDPVSLFKGFQVADPPKPLTAIGFKVGTRRVFYFNTGAKVSSLKLQLNGIKPEQIAKVERHGAFGEVKDITTGITAQKNGSTIEVPIGEEKGNAYSDKFMPPPTDLRRPVFFAVVYLR